jgi:outer membrane protein assembly factor BamB
MGLVVNKSMKQYLVWASVIILVLAVGGYITVLSIFPIVDSGFSLHNTWAQPAKGKGIRCMSVSQDGIILFNTQQALNALQAKTGTVLWSNDDLADGCPELAIHDAFITLSDHSLARVEAKTGVIQWQQPVENSSVKIQTSSEKYVVLNYASDRIDVYDTESGLLLWTLPAERGYVDIYISGDIVYCVGNEIKAIDGKTGEIVWQQALDIGGNTLLAENMLFYEGDNTSDVVAFDVSKRQEIWRIQIDSGWVEELLINGDYLFLADSYYLYALHKQNGELIWQAKSSSPTNLTVAGNNLVVLEGFTRIVKAFDTHSGALKGEIYMSLPQMLLIKNDEISSWNDILFLYKKDTIYAYEVKER